MVEWHPVSHHTVALVVPRITSRTQKTIFPPHSSRRDFLHHFFLRRPILEPAYLFGLLSTCANVVLQALLSGIDGESAWSGRATASCNATASAVAGKMFLAFWCGGGPSTTSLNSKTVPHCLQERVAAMCPWDKIYYLLMSPELLNIHQNTL